MESFVIQSNNQGLAEIEGFLGCFCDENHIANYFATISVPVLQAVENAIIHGNANDPTKQVRLECGFRQGGVYFLVEDQGVGFNYAAFGDCPNANDKGQGIFLIKSLSDHYEYANGGSLLRMDFDINGIEASDSIERMAKLQHYYLPKSVEV